VIGEDRVSPKPRVLVPLLPLQVIPFGSPETPSYCDSSFSVQQCSTMGGVSNLRKKVSESTVQSVGKTWRSDIAPIPENDKLDDVVPVGGKIEGEHQRTRQTPFIEIAIDVCYDDVVPIVFDHLRDNHRQP